MKKCLMLFLVVLMMGCCKPCLSPISNCPKVPVTPVVIPDEWTIQWLGKNSKEVVEAFRMQQEVIKCYEGGKK